MLLSLVDSLRCPAVHDESSLVLSVDTWNGQRVSRGALGCPVCHARYPIEGGTVHFTDAPTTESSEDPRELDPQRLAAQLGLLEPGGVVLLTGHYARAVPELEVIAGVICVVINASVSLTGNSVRFVVADRIPLADGVLRGLAVSGGPSTGPLLPEASRLLRPRGRLVAELASPVPSGIRELARDHVEWVGEREDSAPMIQLGRSLLR